MATIDGEILELVGGIYDAALDRERWHDALDRVRRYFHFHNTVLGVVRYGHEPMAFTVPVNVPQQYLALMNEEYNEEVMRVWGGPEQIARYPLEEPIVMLEVTDLDELRTNKYQRDFGAPQGLIDHVAIALTRDRQQVGNVSFGRHEEVGPITDDVVLGLRQLAPHLRRAALITGILEEERKARTMFEQVLSELRSGVVLVDRRTYIVYANPAAHATIEGGGSLRNLQGKLEMRGETVPGQLQIAIERAAEGDIPLGRRGIAIPGTRADGTPFVAHLLPLGDRTVRTGMPGEAVAALFIADRDEDPRFVVDAATLLYSLTPTEARTFEMIVAGYTSAEIASAMAISANTLKWHSRQLFEKTGQHRRSDLVRLASALRAG